MPTITDWLMVGITFVYVIATIAICLANIKSAKATREQLAESKRQFEEANRAFVTVSFEIVRGGLAVLHIKNHGKQIANDVQVKVCDAFVENVADKKDKESLKRLCEARFNLGIDQGWYICIGSHLQLKQIGNVTLSINTSYHDNLASYNENTIIDLNQYFWSMIYSSPTEDISEQLKKIEKDLQDISKLMECDD